jgi:predicted metalloprotease
MVGGGIGILIVALIVWALGGNPLPLLQGGGGASGISVGEPGSDEEAEFTSAILASTEDVWTRIFREHNATYQPPTLVLFTDVVESGCGTAGSETGPFYCPSDGKIYLDLGFFRELDRLGGPGDFAAAYVIGHEVAHHVQNLAGNAWQLDSLTQAHPAEAGPLSVQFELQADCYAGVWAHHANVDATFLESGDVNEALAAAQAIGDDRLAEMEGRAVQPETFTHGGSEQRERWLRTGIQEGRVAACDTSEG